MNDTPDEEEDSDYQTCRSSCCSDEEEDADYLSRVATVHWNSQRY